MSRIYNNYIIQDRKLRFSLDDRSVLKCDLQFSLFFGEMNSTFENQPVGTIHTSRNFYGTSGETVDEDCPVGLNNAITKYLEKNGVHTWPAPHIF
jgi:hypothetical protein